LLTQLVSKSLVICQELQGEPRYGLLETIRQYVHGKLVESCEEAHVRQRHAEFFAQWSEEATSQMYSPLQANWVKRLDLEQDNLRTALEWAVNVRPLLALRTANALADYFWYLRSAFKEAVHWYERALPNALDAPVELRAYALAYAAHFALQQGKTTQYAEESLILARQGHDKTLLATSLGIAGAVKLEGGDLEGAAACLEEALPLAQTLPVKSWVLSSHGRLRVSAGDYDQAESYFQRSVDAASASYSLLNLTEGLWNLGFLDLLRGDIAKARADLMEGLGLAREMQTRMWTAHIGETLGRVHIHDGAFDDARSLLRQALFMLQDLGMRSCIAHNLDGWAHLATAQGAHGRAARLLGALTAYLNSLGMSMIPLQRALHEQTLAAVQLKLAPTAFQAEWQAGEKLDLEQAIALAMSNQ
jgi:tetratricopeptide (TPR) repeat protein